MAKAFGFNRLEGLGDTVLWLACQPFGVCGMAVPCNTGQGMQDQAPASRSDGCQLKTFVMQRVRKWWLGLMQLGPCG